MVRNCVCTARFAGRAVFLSFCRRGLADVPDSAIVHVSRASLDRGRRPFSMIPLYSRSAYFLFIFLCGVCVSRLAFWKRDFYHHHEEP